MSRRLAEVVIYALIAGCSAKADPPASLHDADPAAPRVDAAESATMEPVEVPTPGAHRSQCPQDMVWVEGDYCPEPKQVCLEHHPEYVRNHRKSERCLEYEQPVQCESKNRTAMSYCVDRFEWPNQAGEKPRVLTQWGEAQQRCESVGKRLCTETEWVFACEGEESLPYTYGYRRDPTACVIDRLYVARQVGLSRWEHCQTSEKCSAEFARLDQREPAGRFAQCVSPFGVHDMNGNANEWVSLPGEQYPERSGLKGGWWGPVRDRCRPTVRFHHEDDWGYEVGFRCCQSAEL